MSKPRFIYNIDCLNCNNIERKMVRVGALFFCEDCFSDIFSTEDPVVEERKVYTKWFKIWDEKVV